MGECRHVKPQDCKQGAVLARDGALWDVMEDWKQGGCVKVRRDGEVDVEHVQLYHIGRFLLVRPALSTTTLEDLEQLPVMDARTDGLRRAGMERAA